MLRSMTGYGDARRQDERLDVAVELRAVNNRFLKVSTRSPDVYASLEGDIERLIRERITRGTVSVTLRVDSQAHTERYLIDQTVLQGYWDQLAQSGRETQDTHSHSTHRSAAAARGCPGAGDLGCRSPAGLAVD